MEYNLLQQTFYYTQCVTRCAALGRLQALKYLIARAGPGVIHNKNNYLIRLAARQRQYHVVWWLIEAGANPHFEDEKVLACAALHGQLDLVRYLVIHGANIQASDNHALRRAAAEGHTDIVAYLLRAGANIHARADGALRMAAVNGHSHTVQLLVESGARIDASSALYGAARHGRLLVVRYLCEQGAEDLFARSAAARGNHWHVVAYLDSFTIN